jgi:hypothetical protein
MDAAQFTMEFGVEKAKRQEAELLTRIRDLVGHEFAEVIDRLFEVGFRHGQAEMAAALDYDLEQILGK